MQRHQTPAKFKYRVLIVIYFSHLFLSIKFNNLLFCLCLQRIKNCLLQSSLLLKVDLPLIKKPFLIETLQNMNYYMSGTFVTKFHFLQSVIKFSLNQIIKVIKGQISLIKLMFNINAEFQRGEMYQYPCLQNTNQWKSVMRQPNTNVNKATFN